MNMKVLLLLGLIFSVLIIIIFALPFIVIKKYATINGFDLIFSISKRLELIPVSGSGPVLVLISNSLPLLLSVLMYTFTTGLFIAYMYKNKKSFSNIAILTAFLGYILYGVQLSDTGTSVVEFFAVLLMKQQASDGSVIFKIAQQEVTTGIGARLLAIIGMLPIFAAIAVKVMENAKRKKYDAIQTPWTIAFRQFKRNKLALVGVGILFVFVIWCFYGPVFSDFALLETKISVAKQKPSLKYILGTDAIGRDIFTRLMYGGRISLTVGFVAVLIEVLIGASIGGISGYYGGKVDNILMRIVDVFLSLPYLPVVIILGTVMSDLDIPPQKRIYFVMLILGFLGWPYLARLVRGQILSLREQEFMLAAEALGLSDKRKIFRHLIPNVIPQIIVTATLGIGGAILSESALSFLGLGVAMPYPSWGNMIQAVRDSYDFAYRAWLWIPPGICIFITVLAINFVGDGLRDAFDPKMKR
ncbi:MAG: ABC transporter permease [Firmicutes bacterium]|nr:ABC transporter permease [Bacillota bacterium]